MRKRNDTDRRSYTGVLQMLVEVGKINWKSYAGLASCVRKHVSTHFPLVLHAGHCKRVLMALISHNPFNLPALA